jgi:hypothetical protein
VLCSPGWVLIHGPSRSITRPLRQLGYWWRLPQSWEGFWPGGSWRFSSCRGLPGSPGVHVAEPLTGEVSAHAGHACCPSSLIEEKATRNVGKHQDAEQLGQGARPSAPERVVF